MSTTESRHAYMIMAHADMPQLHKLLSLLDDPRNELFLHVDKRCREFRPEEFKPQQAKLHLLERQCVYWGDHSQIALELRLFAAAREAGHHVIYHLLSGSDMPLKTQDEIHAFISQHPDKDFIHIEDNEVAYADAWFKISQYHFGMRWASNYKYDLAERITARTRFTIAAFIRKVLGPRHWEGKIVKGANWLSITEETLDFILAHRDQILKQYRHTRCGDEIFVQTLVYNEPHFRDKIYAPNSAAGDLRGLIWTPGKPSPEWLTAADLPALLASDNLFARKFSTQVDASASDLLVERLRPIGH